MGGFAKQRRADRFDALLSGDLADPDARETELATLVASLEEIPPVQARPEFVSSLRERLLVEAAEMPAVERATVDHLTLHQPTVRRERRIATVLGGLAVASATTSMAVASQASLPGETLYPVKRAIENIESNFPGDAAQRSQALLEHAAQRLAEARALTVAGNDGAEVSQALDALNDQTTEAAALALDEYRATGEDAGVREVRAFAQQALGELTALSDLVPESARPALVGAVNALRGIDEAATQACPTCAGPATLPDPMLVANLTDLLSGEPETLTSLAQSAEEIAAEVPTVEPTRPSDVVITVPPTTQPVDPTQAPAAPTTPSPSVENPLDVTTNTKQGPVSTLLDGARTDLEKLAQDAEDGDATLLDNQLINGLTGSLGLSGDAD